MDGRFRRRLRPIAAVVLVFFSWFCIEPWNYAYAAQAKSNPVNSKKIQTASEKFEESLLAAKEEIEEIDRLLAAGEDITQGVEALQGHRQVISLEDKAIRAEPSAPSHTEDEAARAPNEEGRLCGVSGPHPTCLCRG